ncbi:hypothetical protein ACFYRG_50575 [Streptomyces mirabilis]|uniref:hypothetical protein n=1 Tax=Streptomyces mirabilis TaxID=68239 RepID=UPI0036C9A357
MTHRLAPLGADSTWGEPKGRVRDRRLLRGLAACLDCDGARHPGPSQIADTAALVAHQADVTPHPDGVRDLGALVPDLVLAGRDVRVGGWCGDDGAAQG